MPRSSFWKRYSVISNDLFQYLCRSYTNSTDAEKITAQIEELKAQAKMSRDANLDAARKVNDLQARMKDINRKTMAHVSELSMYQVRGANWYLRKVLF